MANSEEMSLEMISNLDDVSDGFALMEKHAVSIMACQSLDDIKERLTLHYQKEKGDGPHFHTVREVINSLRDNDQERRNELDRILNKIKLSLGTLDQNVTQHLAMEQTLHSQSIDDDFQKHSTDLQMGECPILVTGETSSGKSSILNLLLGREILPRRLLSCTSTICKIRYGTDLRVRVQEKDGSWTESMWSSDIDCAQHIEQCVVREEERDNQEITAQNIEIFIPLDFLKSGVYIIDSPGFGEHPRIDKQLIDYISDNDIFAFIYVIKSDNAGGVQEDRLQKILRFIVDKQKASHLSGFDPNSAIFIFNRWDLVPEKEKDIVFNDNLQKLTRCWPNLSTSQVFCMATTKAWDTLKVGYVTKDFSNLLDGIHHLLPVSLDMRLFHSYKWIDHFLSRTLHHISSYLAKTRFSTTELEARQKAANLRLHKVERESDVIMKYLDKQLDKSTRKIALALSDYLKSEEAKAKISCWQLQQLPHTNTDDVWADIEAELDTIIEKRLLDILRSWDEKKQLFQSSQKDLYILFKKEFFIVESHLESIENMIQCDTWSLSDKTDDEMNQFLTLIDNVDMSEAGIFDINLTIFQKIALGIAAPILLPIAVGLLVGTPVALSWDLKKWHKRTNAKRHLGTYIDDPVSFVCNRSMKIMDKVCDYDIVYEYVNNQMEPARRYLDSMRLAIPKLIETNRELIDSIVHDKRSKAEIEEKYLNLEQSIPGLQNVLAGFYNIHIRNYEYKKEHVTVLPPELVLGKPNRKLSIWSEICKGRVKDKDIEGMVIPVSIKTFRKRVSDQHLLTQESYLRKARHPHVAKLIGVFEEKKGIPGLLLEPNLVKGRQELFGFKALPKSSRGRSALMKRCKGILEQVGMGLEYLHYKGLVHMELSLDTIMLLASKDHVKLVNITEPRKADLPENMTNETAADYVYLSGEVLNREIYRARCDMYSLGLVLIELWNQDRVFKEERKLSLGEFIMNHDEYMQKLKGDIGEVNGGEGNALEVDVSGCNPFAGLIKGCLAENATRISSTVFVNEIRNVVIWSEEEDK